MPRPNLLRRKNLRPVAQLTIPTWIFLALVVLIPFFYGVYLSFLDINLASFLPPSFVGFDNYKAVLAASETWSTLRINLIITFMGLLTQIPNGKLFVLLLF